MISCTIDAMEVRYVLNDDIPGAFLQTDYDKVDIHIKMEGKTVSLMKYINPY